MRLKKQIKTEFVFGYLSYRSVSVNCIVFMDLFEVLILFHSFFLQKNCQPQPLQRCPAYFVDFFYFHFFIVFIFYFLLLSLLLSYNSYNSYNPSATYSTKTTYNHYAFAAFWITYLLLFYI